MEHKPILYAEDDENDAFFMERAFKQAGIANRLVIAADGQQAIDYLAGAEPFANRTEHPFPALALLDLNMPGRSGIEVLKWIRTQPATCILPVLMVTSSNRHEDIHRAYIQGANGYLVKPSQPDDLMSLVKSIKDFWLTFNYAIPPSLKPLGDGAAEPVITTA